MTKRPRTPKRTTQSALLNGPAAEELLGIGRTRFWQLRKEFNVQRVPWSKPGGPLYRREDILKLAGPQVVDDPTEPPARIAEVATVEPPKAIETAGPLSAPPAAPKALPTEQSVDPGEVFAVDYYDPYLVPEHLSHLTVEEFRRLKNPLAKPKPSK